MNETNGKKYGFRVLLQPTDQKQMFEVFSDTPITVKGDGTFQSLPKVLGEEKIERNLVMGGEGKANYYFEIGDRVQYIGPLFTHGGPVKGLTGRVTLIDSKLNEHDPDAPEYAVEFDSEMCGTLAAS